MQWKYEALKRQQKKLMYINKVLFDDMEKKESEISEIDVQINSLVDELHKLNKKIESKMDNKKILLEMKNEILSDYNIFSKNLYSVMEEISTIEESMVDNIPKEEVNQ